jgi:hypothetical protein
MRVDTHIPIPEDTLTGRGRAPKYPFADMPIGGSFGVAPTMAAKVATAARIWKSRHTGWDYRTRKTEKEFRVWRIA